MRVRARLRAPFLPVGGPVLVPEVVPWSTAVPAAPHPALGGMFDPLTYDWTGLTGLTNPAALVARTSNLRMDQQPAYTAADVDAGLFTIDVNNLSGGVTAKLSNSRARSVTVSAKASSFVELDHCELTSPVAGTYTGGGPLWMHHCRTLTGGDSVGNVRTLLGGGYPLLEYNDLAGVGYVPWLPLAGSSPTSFSATGDTITAAGHGFTVGQRVLVYGTDVFGTGLPVPLRQQEMLWVHSVPSPNTLRVQAGTKSAAYLPIGQAGSAVSFSVSGSGTIQAAAADGLHSDGFQVSQDGWATVRRNRIRAHPNCCIIVKSDLTSSDGLGNPIRNVRIEDNLLEHASKQGTVFIYVRGGSTPTPLTGFRSRPQYVTILRNYFRWPDGSVVAPGSAISSGSSTADRAVFVETEQQRADAVAAQTADPEATAAARSAAGLPESTWDAATWIVWAGNRDASSGALIAPPRPYYTGA